MRLGEGVTSRQSSSLTKASAYVNTVSRFGTLAVPIARMARRRARQRRRERVGTATIPQAPLTPGAPSPREWATMASYGSFARESTRSPANRCTHKSCQSWMRTRTRTCSPKATCMCIFTSQRLLVIHHDCGSAIIRPEGVSEEDAKSLPLHKHWVAKIKEIRGKDGSSDVSIQRKIS